MTITSLNNNAQVYAYESRNNIQESSDFEIKRDVIYKNIYSQKQSENFQNWYQDLLDQAEIVDNRKFYF